MNQRPDPALKRFKNTIRLLVAFVALIAQAGVIGAGVLDARSGASAASHFESGGTNLHFAHNEADCFMCRAQHLGDAAPVGLAPPPPTVPVSTELVYSSYDFVAAACVDNRHSRAPPSIV